MAGLGTRIFTDVIVNVATLNLSGFAEGEAVKMEYNDDRNHLVVGADGHGGRAVSADMSGRFTFKLLSTSNANTKLSALVAMDSLILSGKAVFPIVISYPDSKTIATGIKSWLVKCPDISFHKKEVTETEWVFETHEMISFVGGNE